MYKNRLENSAFIAFFALSAVLLYLVFAPFVQILTLAAVLAALLQRPYESLSAALYGRRSLAAALVVILVLIFLIVPLFFISVQIFSEAQTIYALAPGGGLQYVQTVQDGVTHVAQRFYPGFTFNAGQYIGSAFSFISGNLAAIVSVTLYILLKTFLMLLAFFFFLRDGRSMLVSLVTISPFGKLETYKILKQLYQTIETVFKGTIVVAFIRWLLIGAIFYFLGIPNAVLWGSIGGIISATPGLGTLFVIIPAAAYLFIKGSALAAIALAVLGLAIFILVDNILTPYFFGKGIEVPQVFILFSILGGIIFFGPIGFIMGPLVLSLFLSLVSIYSAQQDKKNRPE